MLYTKGDELVMNISKEEVIRLTNILHKTRKMRVKFKLSKRISEGTFECFQEWLKDDKEQDRVPHGVRMPDSIELINRYGN